MQISTFVQKLTCAGLYIDLGYACFQEKYYRVCIAKAAVNETVSDDSCVRGGLHGYKATGHAREKPNLPICRYEIGDVEIIILV